MAKVPREQGGDYFVTQSNLTHQATGVKSFLIQRRPAAVALLPRTISALEFSPSPQGKQLPFGTGGLEAVRERRLAMSYQLLTPCPPNDGPVSVRLTAKVLRGEDMKGMTMALLRLVRESGGNALHLDLGEVERPTASGLAKLLTLHKKLQAAGVTLALCNVGSLVYEVLELSALTQLLDVRPNA
jgi:anti-anti-sigma regulatory factor